MKEIQGRVTKGANCHGREEQYRRGKNWKQIETDSLIKNIEGNLKERENHGKN